VKQEIQVKQETQALKVTSVQLVPLVKPVLKAQLVPKEIRSQVTLVLQVRSERQVTPVLKVTLVTLVRQEQQVTLVKLVTLVTLAQLVHRVTLVLLVTMVQLDQPDFLG
jgi:hypothetical protein